MQKASNLEALPQMVLLDYFQPALDSFQSFLELHVENALHNKHLVEVDIGSHDASHGTQKCATARGAHLQCDSDAGVVMGYFFG